MTKKLIVSENTNNGTGAVVWPIKANINQRQARVGIFTNTNGGQGSA